MSNMTADSGPEQYQYNPTAPDTYPPPPSTYPPPPDGASYSPPPTAYPPPPESTSYPPPPAYATPPGVTTDYYGGDVKQQPPPQGYPEEEQAPIKPPRPSSTNAGTSMASSTSVSGASTGQTSVDTGEQQQPEKPGFQEKMYRWSNRRAPKINKLFNKLGSEGWWPGPMETECDKCARILKSFVKDGIYSEDSREDLPAAGPGVEGNAGPKDNWVKGPDMVRIPQKAIQNAKGIAIFSTIRTGGPYLGGMGGAGVVVARLPDGSWSPPSGICPNALSLGMMIGVDVYDCVCVLNTQEAVDAFASKVRFSLGGTLGVAAGPIGAGGQLDTDFKNAKPVWSYARSRGLYAGLHSDGTFIVTRPDANGDFYGEKGITADRILKGDVPRLPPGSTVPEDGSRMWPEGAARLMAVLRDAEGKPADPELLRQVEEGPMTAGQVEDPEKAMAAAAAAEGGRPTSSTGAGARPGSEQGQGHEQEGEKKPWYKKLVK